MNKTTVGAPGLRAIGAAAALAALGGCAVVGSTCLLYTSDAADE